MIQNVLCQIAWDNTQYYCVQVHHQRTVELHHNIVHNHIEHREPRIMPRIDWSYGNGGRFDIQVGGLAATSRSPALAKTVQITQADIFQSPRWRFRIFGVRRPIMMSAGRWYRCPIMVTRWRCQRRWWWRFHSRWRSDWFRELEFAFGALEGRLGRATFTSPLPKGCRYGSVC